MLPDDLSRRVDGLLAVRLRDLRLPADGHPNPGSAVNVVTASFGVAVTAAAPLHAEDLIARADTALYRAKTRGGIAS